MRSLRAVVLKSVVVQTRTHLKCVSEPVFKSKLSGFLPCVLAGTSGHCCLLGSAEGRDGAASAHVLSSGETGQCPAYSSLPEPPPSLRSDPWSSPPSSSWWAGGRGTVSAPAWDLPTHVRVSGFTGGSWCRPQAPGGWVEPPVRVSSGITCSAQPRLQAEQNPGTPSSHPLTFRGGE